jgi:hypothetical protein
MTKKSEKNHDANSNSMVMVASLKGQSNGIFYIRFFHRWTPPKPITRYLKTFRIWLRIRGDNRDF